MSIRDKRVGFVGGGNMGEALVRGLTKTGLVPVGHLLMADVRADRLEELKRLYGIVVVPDNVTLVRRADVVILAVKPQILGEVLDEIAPATPGKLLISVAAGVSTSEIRRHLPPGTRMIRVMPNTPALVLGGRHRHRARRRARGRRPGHRPADLRGGRAGRGPGRGDDGRGDRALRLRARPTSRSWSRRWRTAACGSGWTGRRR